MSEKFRNRIEKKTEQDDFFGPIRVSFGTKKEHYYGVNSDREFAQYLENLLKRAIHINYAEEPQSLKEKGFKNAGKFSYVISSIDEKPKMTDGLATCTSIVAVGRDKKTGKNISFISHQDPFFFTDEEKAPIFIKDLEQILDEFQERIEEGSVDIILLGGNYLDGEYQHKGLPYSEYYYNSIALLSSVISSYDFPLPEVALGPKLSPGGDDFIFDTEKRVVHYIRSENANRDNTNNRFTFLDLMNGEDEKWHHDKNLRL